MATTERFGLRKAGGPSGGSILDDGSRYSNADRDTLDHLLAYFEGHRHEGGERLGNPIAAPVLDLQNVGQLAGNTTFYYVVSFVDQYGLESAPSPEVALATPATPGRPDAPTLVVGDTSAGQLAAGSYRYGLTRILTTGDQTPLSSTTTAVLGGGDDTVTVQLPAYDSQTNGFGVWRQGAAESGPTRIAVVMGDPQFVDDGSVPPDDCACDPFNLPPTQDVFVASAGIGLTLAAADAATVNGGLVSRWRIYRATASGGYAEGSLLIELPAVDGVLPTSYVDNGTETLKSGLPTPISQTLTPSVKLAGGSGGGGGGYVANPVVADAEGDYHAISVADDGALLTQAYDPLRPGTAYNPGRGPVLTAIGGSMWRLGIGDQAEPTTTAVTSVDLEVGAPTFGPGAGPIIFTRTGSLGWRLGVDPDGALTQTSEETA